MPPEAESIISLNKIGGIIALIIAVFLLIIGVALLIILIGIVLIIFGYLFSSGRDTVPF